MFQCIKIFQVVLKSSLHWFFLMIYKLKVNAYFPDQKNTDKILWQKERFHILSFQDYIITITRMWDIPQLTSSVSQSMIPSQRDGFGIHLVLPHLYSLSAHVLHVHSQDVTFTYLVSSYEMKRRISPFHIYIQVLLFLTYH